MMPWEGKVDATILIARGPMTPAEAVSSASGGATPATGFNFHLLVKDPSLRPSRRHRQKALDSSLKQMENKVRT
jgi:hypothetical protein